MSDDLTEILMMNHGIANNGRLFAIILFELEI